LYIVLPSHLSVENMGELESHIRIRLELMDAVRAVIRRDGLRQSDAAALFGVAQPRVSDLVRGKVELFSIDTLVGMLAAAGVRVDLELSGVRSKKRAASVGGARRPRGTNRNA
jgi:predicted XRE-type DNA-binding protein